MKSYVTYCSACDSEVLVKLDPEADEPLDPSNVICLDRVASCEEEECPLAGASPSELRDRLEFLPSEARGGKPRTLQEAEEIVEKARIASLKRRTGLES
ncbi:MAG: hypothetical protein V3S52_02180 [Gemmatimonadota bacterium]